MKDFWLMGGYWPFVWGAYGFTLALLLWNFFKPLWDHRRVLRALEDYEPNLDEAEDEEA